MNVTDPTTWHDLSEHPSFGGGHFDPAWYDGDLRLHLAMLRSVTLDLIRVAAMECELCVLDDCTMYVKVSKGGQPVAEIYPSETDEYKPCYFVDGEGIPDETRVASAADVLGLLTAR